MLFISDVIYSEIDYDEQDVVQEPSDKLKVYGKKLP